MNEDQFCSVCDGAGGKMVFTYDTDVYEPCDHCGGTGFEPVFFEIVDGDDD